MHLEGRFSLFGWKENGRQSDPRRSRKFLKIGRYRKIGLPFYGNYVRAGRRPGGSNSVKRKARAPLKTSAKTGLSISVFAKRVRGNRRGVFLPGQHFGTRQKNGRRNSIISLPGCHVGAAVAAASFFVYHVRIGEAFLRRTVGSNRISDKLQ